MRDNLPPPETSVPELYSDPYPFSVAFMYGTSDPAIDLDGWRQTFTSRHQLRSQLVDGGYISEEWAVADMEAMIKKLERREYIKGDVFFFFLYD